MSEMISKSFQKCGISNAGDGNDDDILWEDPTDDTSDTDTADINNYLMSDEKAV